MMDDAFQPRRPSRPDCKHGVTEALGKDTPSTMGRAADKTARDNAKADPLT
jgi:hypothetical protein